MGVIMNEEKFLLMNIIKVLDDSYSARLMLEIYLIKNKESNDDQVKELRKIILLKIRDEEKALELLLK
jgi:wyosine [tRNA(Phe)-imidazoG37] synthetase (radical SAM superfamily)